MVEPGPVLPLVPVAPVDDPQVDPQPDGPVALGTTTSDSSSQVTSGGE
jgi:hypothetical protein